jgi:hypothetical protein
MKSRIDRYLFACSPFKLIFILLAFTLLSSSSIAQVGFEVGVPYARSAYRNLSGSKGNTLGGYFELTNRNNRIINTFRYYNASNSHKKEHGYSIGAGYYAEIKKVKWLSAAYSLSYMFTQQTYDWTDSKTINSIACPEVKLLFHLSDNFHLSSIYSYGLGYENGGRRPHERRHSYVPYFFSFGVGYSFPLK